MPGTWRLSLAAARSSGGRGSVAACKWNYRSCPRGRGLTERCLIRNAHRCAIELRDQAADPLSAAVVLRGFPWQRRGLIRSRLPRRVLSLSARGSMARGLRASYTWSEVNTTWDAMQSSASITVAIPSPRAAWSVTFARLARHRCYGCLYVTFCKRAIESPHARASLQSCFVHHHDLYTVKKHIERFAADAVRRGSHALKSCRTV